jgi:L-amino acid N-acyltransferase YncA
LPDEEENPVSLQQVDQWVEELQRAGETVLVIRWGDKELPDD